jgi:hypothetical protein
LKLTFTGDGYEETVIDDNTFTVENTGELRFNISVDKMKSLTAGLVYTATGTSIEENSNCNLTVTAEKAYEKAPNLYNLTVAGGSGSIEALTNLQYEITEALLYTSLQNESLTLTQGEVKMKAADDNISVRIENMGNVVYYNLDFNGYTDNSSSNWY